MGEFSHWFPYRCSANHIERCIAFYIIFKINVKYINITYNLNTNQFKKAFQIAKQKQKYVLMLVKFVNRRLITSVITYYYY